MSKRKWIEPAVGWGMRVAGDRDSIPYIAYEFSWDKDKAKLFVSKSYHHICRVAIVPYAAAKRAGLLKKPKGQ